MKEEIKIITLGDIFKNLETEEKAFKFKDYITNLQDRIDKAVEYINKEKYVSADENCEIIAGYHIDKLLNILKGE